MTLKDLIYPKSKSVRRIMARALLSLAFGLISPDASAGDNVNWFSFDGHLFDGTGAPQTGVVSIKVQIVGDTGAGDCVLREENYGNVTLASGGGFSLNIGSDVLATGYTMAQVFSNLSPLTAGLSPVNCSVDYSANPNAVRALRVFVNGDQMNQDFSIFSAPSVMTAQ